MTEVKQGRIGKLAVIKHVCDTGGGRVWDLVK